jgi:hypothetical protein
LASAATAATVNVAHNVSFDLWAKSFLIALAASRAEETQRHDDAAVTVVASVVQRRHHAT